MPSTRPSFFLLACCFFARVVFAESPEAVATRYVRLAAEGPIEGSGKFERRMRNMLRVRCLTTRGVVVNSAETNGDRAVVTLDLALDKQDRMTGEAMPMDVLPLRVELARDGETWRVDETVFPDDDLAEQLLAANPEQMTQLLASGRVFQSTSRAVVDRGFALLNSGKFDEGLRAAGVARTVAITTGDRGGEALALGIAMFVFNQNRDFPRALDASREALTIAQASGDPGVLGRAWYNHGRLLSSGWSSLLGNIEAERNECYRKALLYAERGEDPVLAVRILHSMGIIASNHADFLTAREYVDRAAPLARDAGDVTGELSAESLLGFIYYNQGDRELGRFHQARALAIAERTHAYAYPSLVINSAYQLIIDGKHEEGRALLAKVLVPTEDGGFTTIGPVPQGELVNAMRALALVEAENGRFNEAECLLRYASVRDGMEPQRFLMDLVPFARQRGDEAKALRFALETLTTPNLVEWEQVNALGRAALAYRGLHDPARAQATLLEAIELQELLESRVAGDEQQRAGFAEYTTRFYELAAELAVDLGDRAQALAFLERGRARVLTDILEHGRPRALDEAEEALQEQQRAMERELAQLRVDLDRAEAAGARREASALSARLRDARAAHGSFVDGVRARAELRRATGRRPDSRTLREVIEHLPPHTVAVEYFVADDRLHIFVCRKGAGVVHRSQSIDREALEKRVNRFVEMLAAGDLRVEAEARRVHEVLIDPIRRELAGANALIVIPDEILWRVPFAALADREGRFLVERAAIVYAPSLNAYAAMQTSPKRNAAPVALLAIGNPAMDAAARNAATSFYRGTTLAPIPDAEREVDAIQQLYRDGDTLVLKRGRATESATKSALGRAAVAHFATHALLDDANPMYSRLALARGEGVAEDGWLESWEIARMEVAADTVVLSACETARGEAGGEGVVGMAWSFFLAGARSIVATQWNIASNSTAQFMVAFHRTLRDDDGDSALHKAQALRRTQLQFLARKETRNPFYWAPFVLLGDPSLTPPPPAHPAGGSETHSARATRDGSRAER